MAVKVPDEGALAKPFPAAYAAAVKTFLLVVLLIGLGYGLAVYFSGKRSPAEMARREINAAVSGTVSNVMETLQPERLKEELAQSGKIVRSKAAELGQQVADGTADIRITAAIKGRIAADTGLASLRVSVSTTAGLVTLSGAVRDHDELRRIMLLALETDGVREVVSTLQVIP
jgi:osmotically-inducible protein OsmY